MKNGWIVGGVAVVGLCMALAYLNWTCGMSMVEGKASAQKNLQRPASPTAAAKPGPAASQEQKSGLQSSMMSNLETHTFGMIRQLAEHGDPVSNRRDSWGRVMGGSPGRPG